MPVVGLHQWQAHCVHVHLLIDVDCLSAILASLSLFRRCPLVIIGVIIFQKITKLPLEKDEVYSRVQIKIVLFCSVYFRLI